MTLLTESTDTIGNKNPEVSDWNGAGEQYASNARRASWSAERGEPVVYDGRTLVVDPDALRVGVPHGAVFEGVPLVVLKQPSGDVDFFYID